MEKKHLRIEYAFSLVGNSGDTALERRQPLGGRDSDAGRIDAH
jgi:hypothetical protein